MPIFPLPHEPVAFFEKTVLLNGLDGEVGELIMVGFLFAIGQDKEGEGVSLR